MDKTYYAQLTNTLANSIRLTGDSNIIACTGLSLEHIRENRELLASEYKSVTFIEFDPIVYETYQSIDSANKLLFFDVVSDIINQQIIQRYPTATFIDLIGIGESAGIIVYLATRISAISRHKVYHLVLQAPMIPHGVLTRDFVSIDFATIGSDNIDLYIDDLCNVETIYSIDCTNSKTYSKDLIPHHPNTIELNIVYKRPDAV